MLTSLLLPQLSAQGELEAAKAAAASAETRMEEQLEACVKVEAELDACSGAGDLREAAQAARVGRKLVRGERPSFHALFTLADGTGGT